MRKIPLNTLKKVGPIVVTIRMFPKTYKASDIIHLKLPHFLCFLCYCLCFFFAACQTMIYPSIPTSQTTHSKHTHTHKTVKEIAIRMNFYDNFLSLFSCVCICVPVSYVSTHISFYVVIWISCYFLFNAFLILLFTFFPFCFSSPLPGTDSPTEGGGRGRSGLSGIMILLWNRHYILFCWFW